MKRFKKKELHQEPQVPQEQKYTLIIYWCDVWWFTKWVRYYEYTLDEINKMIDHIKSNDEWITLWMFTYKREHIKAYKVKIYEASDR